MVMKSWVTNSPKKDLTKVITVVPSAAQTVALAGVPPHLRLGRAEKSGCPKHKDDQQTKKNWQKKRCDHMSFLLIFFVPCFLLFFLFCFVFEVVHLFYFSTQSFPKRSRTQTAAFLKPCIILHDSQRAGLTLTGRKKQHSKLMTSGKKYVGCNFWNEFKYMFQWPSVLV